MRRVIEFVSDHYSIELHPFNFTGKEAGIWPLIQWRVSFETVYYKVFPLIDSSRLPDDKKRNLKQTIECLFAVSVHAFLRSNRKDDNPLHHSFIVLEIVLRIAFGEGRLSYRDVRKLAVLSILHDLGFAKSSSRVKTQDIDEKIYLFKEGKCLRREVVEIINRSVEARKEHMLKGIPIAKELLSRLNETFNTEDGFSVEDIEEIAGLVGTHDNPNIAKPSRFIKSL
jgi:hypothetical protein